LCYAPDLKFYRVWSKQGRVEYPVLEVDQVADGWAVCLIVKRGKRRYAETVDKAKAREMLQRQHDIGNTVELLER